MKVSTIMSPAPVTVGPDVSVAAARDILLTEDVRHLPVLEANRLVGIVSDRDLFPDEEELAPRPGGGHPKLVRDLADVMSTDVSVVHPEDSVVSAGVAFVLQRVGCLPVVQDDGGLVGILSELDMLTAYVKLCREGVLVEEGDVPTVSTIMTSYPLTAAPSVTASQARQLMSSVRARHLPVLDGTEMLGIVSDRDVRRAEAAGHPEKITLGDLMAAEPLTVDPLARAPAAAALMVTAKVSALPVVAGEGLVGIVTLTDLLDQCLGSLREREVDAEEEARSHG